ncbi:MAG: protease pro-enzyme activation domain-containing protein [Thermoplasmata archaeon]
MWHGSANHGPRRALALGIVLMLVLLGVTLVLPAATSNGSPAAPGSTPTLYELLVGPRAAVPLTGPMPPTPASGTPYLGSVSVFLTLSLNNQSRLAALLAQLSDPSSPEYHQYLTAGEFTAEFSPSVPAYQLAVAYFGGSSGVRVTSYPDRIGLLLEGPGPAVGALFGVSFAQVRTPTGSYYGPVGAPTLPASLAREIGSVDGLSNYGSGTSATTRAIASGPAPAANALPAGYPVPTPCGTSGEQCVWGSDLQVAYDEQSLLSITYPLHEVVATILWAGQNSQGQPVGPYVPADIYDYYNLTLPAGEPHSTVYPVPYDGAPMPGISATNDTTGAAGENTLDLEMVGSTAPGAAIYNVYGKGPGSAETDGAFAFTLSPTGYPGLANVSVISNSWGALDANDSSWVPLLEEAQARGITVLAATGDAGDNPSSSYSVGSQIEFPSVMAYNTFGVTAVGGTALTLNSDPGSPAFLSIESESAWYEPQSGSGTIGSSGGVSTVFAEPSWQLATEANAVIAATGSIGRGVPDVAGVAQDMFVLATTSGSQLTYRDFGTSVATPVVAGLVAEANAVLVRYHQPDVGFLNPALYSWANQMIQPPPTGSVVYGTYDSSLPMLPFYDVTQGANYVYSARPGYDLVTGWGSLDDYNFTAFVLSFDYAGSSFALDGVSDVLNLSALAVTSVFPSSTVNALYNASIEQTAFLANSLGAPIYWVQNAVDLQGAPSSGWQVTETASVYYPFYGLYPHQTIWVYRMSSGGFATLPATWTITTRLERPVGSSAEVVFDVNGQAVSTPVPGAEFIIGGSGYQYYWQGEAYADGPYPNTPAPSGLAPQFGILGGPSGTRGVFASPTSATVTPTYLRTGRGTYVAPAGGGVVNATIAQATESAENLRWGPSGGSWQATLASGSVDQGFFVYSSADAGNPVNFQLAVFAVVFNETGLGSGDTWSVTLGGITESSSSTTITFEMLNGTYAFSVPSVDGSNPSPGSGSLTVLGNSSKVALSFAASCAGLSCDFAYIPGGWVIYAILALVALAVIAVIARVAVRRPRRPVSTPGPGGTSGPVEPMVPPYNPR